MKQKLAIVLVVLIGGLIWISIIASREEKTDPKRMTPHQSPKKNIQKVIPVNKSNAGTKTVDSEFAEDLLNWKFKKSVDIGDATLKIMNSIKGRKWRFDRYPPGRWYERESDKDAQYIYIDYEITSKAKTVKLPALMAFSICDTFDFIGVLGTEFFKWEDFGSYLGNYHDSGNDFSKRDTVKFTSGIEVSNETLKTSTVLIAALKEPCLVQRNKRFRKPPLYFAEQGCVPAPIARPADLLTKVIPVKVFNKNILTSKFRHSRSGPNKPNRSGLPSEPKPEADQPQTDQDTGKDSPLDKYFE